jgi:hypothetical protein
LGEETAVGRESVNPCEDSSRSFGLGVEEGAEGTVEGTAATGVVSSVGDSVAVPGLGVDSEAANASAGGMEVAVKVAVGSSAVGLGVGVEVGLGVGVLMTELFTGFSAARGDVAGVGKPGVEGRPGVLKAVGMALVMPGFDGPLGVWWVK